MERQVPSSRRPPFVYMPYWLCVRLWSRPVETRGPHRTPPPPALCIRILAYRGQQHCI